MFSRSHLGLRFIITILSISAGLAVTAPSAFARAIISASPTDGTTVTTPRPTFTFTVDGFATDGSDDVFVYISQDWYVDSLGLLSTPTMPYGYMLDAKPTAPGSTTFTASEYVDLKPGLYYWQWMYYDSGCTNIVDPVTLQIRPLNCHPNTPTTCNSFIGRCQSPVMKLTVAAPIVAPPTPKDTKTPTARAFAASGKRGAKIHLKVFVSDDSGRAGFKISVFRSNRVVASRTFALGSPGYWNVNYSSATAFKGHFCVQGFDASGNWGSISCAALTVR